MSIDQTLLKLAQQSVAEALSKKAGAEAFLPMPGGQPPMDPAAAGGGMPMDPAMAGGAPPMDPAMMGMDPAMAGGAPPMDPAMAGGMPPVDPAMAGGAPPVDPTALAAMAGAAAPPAATPPGLDATTISLLIPIIKNAVTEAIQAAGGADGKGAKKEKKQSAEDRLAAIEQKIGIQPAAAAPAAAPAPADAAAAPAADPLASIGGGAAPPAPDPNKMASAKDDILASINRLRNFGSKK